MTQFLLLGANGNDKFASADLQFVGDAPKSARRTNSCKAEVLSSAFQHSAERAAEVKAEDKEVRWSSYNGAEV